jgi:phage major head subunit gpT-like protein
MSKHDAQPDYLLFQCPLTVEAVDGDGARQMPRFRMVAYTGGTMRIAGFPHPVVVDLEGLAIDRQDIPVRLDHKPHQGVGHTQKVAIENGQVLAEGLVSRDTSWARDVAKSGVNGFPWQASIGAAVVDAQFIPNGQHVVVNGRTFTGPLHVVRRAVLKEISFVDSGADANTSAKVAARNPEQEEQKPMKETATAVAETVETQDTQTDTQETPETVSESPTPEQPTSTPTTVNAAATTDGDPVVAMRRQMAAETRRVEAIRKLCRGKHPDIEAQAIEEGWDETKVELHVLRASRPQVPAVTSRPRNTGPQVFEAVALMAAGCPMATIEAAYAEPILEAADKLRGVGIQEFCELASGQQLPRYRRDASGWLQAAFSTASLPNILSNIANKMLLEGYNYIEDSWRKIAKVASVNDFKEHSRYRMTGSFKFEQVGPDGELKHGKLDEQKYGQKADTHGIMFALTRQMIINDDMGAFTDIPRQIGMGAAESIADAVWGLWLSNPTQADGKAFFSAEHKNYSEGADTALSVDSLTAAEVLFGEQTKPNGRPLGIPASILLVPTALKVPAELLMKSLLLNETTTANKGKPNTNPHVGKYEVVSSVYLSNSSFTGYSSKAWYLQADPNRLPAIEVAFLNGVDRPTVEKTDADFNTLGVQFRGYIDFGVREQDYRGALKMKGEA